ncbi:MAG: hypothetical protein ABJA20_08965, partial [Novosphingobium sp.]
VSAEVIDAALATEVALLVRDQRRLAIALAPRGPALGLLVRAMRQRVYAGRDGALSLLRDVWGLVRGRS